MCGGEGGCPERVWRSRGTEDDTLKELRPQCWTPARTAGFLGCLGGCFVHLANGVKHSRPPQLCCCMGFVDNQLSPNVGLGQVGRELEKVEWVCIVGSMALGHGILCSIASSLWCSSPGSRSELATLSDLNPSSGTLPCCQLSFPSLPGPARTPAGTPAREGLDTFPPTDGTGAATFLQAALPGVIMVLGPGQ